MCSFMCWFSNSRLQEKQKYRISLQRDFKINVHEHFRHPPSKTPWMYCSGHAGIKGNDRAHRLAGKATNAKWLAPRKM